MFQPSLRPSCASWRSAHLNQPIKIQLIGTLRQPRCVDGRKAAGRLEFLITVLKLAVSPRLPAVNSGVNDSSTMPIGLALFADDHLGFELSFICSSGHVLHVVRVFALGAIFRRDRQTTTSASCLIDAGFAQVTELRAFVSRFSNSS
jgi:hypothetical protein